MHVETIDLVVEGHLALHGQLVDEVVDRLGAVARPVVDSLKFATRGTIPRKAPRPRRQGMASVDPVSEGGFEACAQR
jgi:hypothetical protein